MSGRFDRSPRSLSGQSPRSLSGRRRGSRRPDRCRERSLPDEVRYRRSLIEIAMGIDRGSVRCVRFRSGPRTGIQLRIRGGGHDSIVGSVDLLSSTSEVFKTSEVWTKTEARTSFVTRAGPIPLSTRCFRDPRLAATAVDRPLHAAAPRRTGSGCACLLYKTLPPGCVGVRGHHPHR